MSIVKITFPDGSVKEFEKGISGYQIAESISPRLAAEASMDTRILSDKFAIIYLQSYFSV